MTSPAGAGGVPEIDYDGRRFRKVTDDPEGAPVAAYHQAGHLVWAEFAGGEAQRGSLVGTVTGGVLHLAYAMVLTDGQVVSGACLSVPRLLPDGRILLHETWERFGPNGSRGTSQLEEVR